MDEKEIRQLLASKFVKYVKSHGLGDVVVEDEYIKFSFKHGGRVVRFGIKGYTLIAELFFSTTIKSKYALQSSTVFKLFTLPLIFFASNSCLFEVLFAP